jgi:hypothetical protein
VVHALLSLQAAPTAITQVPVDTEQGLQVPQAVPVLCHVPLPSQTWGCWPLHCLALGLHDPVHVPLLVLQT